MQKISWNDAKFIRSSIWPKQYPRLCSRHGTPLPAIALAGRSNVGKSSLLNTLASTRSLVKVSSTPGKTQMLNFFCINDVLFFVDLPGYGFAKCPLAVKKEWSEMIRLFFQTCKHLCLLLVLLDIRRNPSEDDLQLIEWANYHNIPLLVVLTKIDKVKKSELLIRTKEILSFLPTVAFIEHSSQTGAGTQDLRRYIIQHIEGKTECHN